MTSLFNRDFLNEYEKKWLDDTVESIARKEGDVSRIRLNELLLSYLAIKKVIKNNEEVKITYNLFDLDRTMGYINLVGKRIEFADGRLFKDVARVATNFEVYPKLDGTVEMNFTFYGFRLDKGVN